MVPGRHLQSLHILWQAGTHVSLRALGCIAPQLRSLELERCRIEAESDPTDFFSLLGKLEDLNLKAAEVDAGIGGVSCPLLRKLGIDAFAAEGESMMHCIDAFSGKVPALRHLALSVIEAAGVIPAEGFPRLELIMLDLDASELIDEEEDWPGLCPQICLPASVTTLACKSMVCLDIDDTCQEWDQEIDLHSMLALARVSIGAGVGIRDLRCAHCATLDYARLYRELAEMGELGHELYQETIRGYGRASQALQGLTKLDLRKSPNCTEAAVNEIVWHAPDLAWLGVAAGGHHTRSVLCCNLKELAVLCSAGIRVHSELALELLLEEATCLERCTVQMSAKGGLLQSDRLALRLDSWGHAGISAFASPQARSGCTPGPQSEWQLGVTTHKGSDSSHTEKHVSIAFAWAADKEAWDISVQ